MSCGYACVGCGRCRGKPRELNITSVCFRCGHDNPKGALRCEECGLELPRPVSMLLRNDAKHDVERDAESDAMRCDAKRDVERDVENDAKRCDAKRDVERDVENDAKRDTQNVQKNEP